MTDIYKIDIATIEAAHRVAHNPRKSSLYQAAAVPHFARAE
jgi:hypothetical protein